MKYIILTSILILTFSMLFPKKVQHPCFQDPGTNIITNYLISNLYEKPLYWIKQKEDIMANNNINEEIENIKSAMETLRVAINKADNASSRSTTEQQRNYLLMICQQANSLGECIRFLGCTINE